MYFTSLKETLVQKRLMPTLAWAGAVKLFFYSNFCCCLLEKFMDGPQILMTCFLSLFEEEGSSGL